MPVENYIAPHDSPFGKGTTNIGHLIDDLDQDGEDPAWRTNMARWTINDVLGTLDVRQEKLCGGGDEPEKAMKDLVVQAANGKSPFQYVPNEQYPTGSDK